MTKGRLYRLHFAPWDKKVKFASVSPLDRFPEIAAWQYQILGELMPFSCACCGSRAHGQFGAAELFERGDGRHRREPTLTIVVVPFCASRKCREAATARSEEREAHERVLGPVAGKDAPREVRHVPLKPTLARPIDPGAVCGEAQEQVFGIFERIHGSEFKCVGCGDPGMSAAYSLGVLTRPGCDVTLRAQVMPHCDRPRCKEKAYVMRMLAEQENKKETRSSAGICSYCRGWSADEKKELQRQTGKLWRAFQENQGSASLGEQDTEVKSIVLVPPVDFELLVSMADDGIAEAVDHFLDSQPLSCVACGGKARKAEYGTGLSSAELAIGADDVTVQNPDQIMLAAQLFPHCGKRACETRASVLLSLAIRDDRKESGISACAYCEAYSGNERADLLRCSACRSVRYCSKECQRKHWPNHKKICGELAKAIKEERVGSSR
ncbi:hypothetical protein DFJ74DRAFT_717798 [Hyaloraphidium curvatum]|nr:hypothetical protein DFJ74DRAFT_717798 [Hyaloraphidium curvatum]